VLSNPRGEGCEVVLEKNLGRIKKREAIMKQEERCK
jgi:hypothetical protein